MTTTVQTAAVPFATAQMQDRTRGRSWFLTHMTRLTSRRARKTASHRIAVELPRHRPPDAKPPPKNRSRRWLIGTSIFLAAAVVTGLGVATRRSGDNVGAITASVPLPVISGSLAGSALPGMTRYPVPAGALFVANSGSDSSPGTTSAPVATLGRAITLAHPHQSIVLRAGSYHESVLIPDSLPGLSIQSYPGEAVWLDGSVPVSNWTPQGPTWVHAGWNSRFDSSSSFTAGVNDPSFIAAAYPMAAHPDQIWINGVAQQQVAGTDDVIPGSFHADYANHQLMLGTNPIGQDVRASSISQAIVSQAADVTIRGIGVRRYADSIWQLGAIRVTGANSLLENVIASQNAAIGFSVGHGSGITLRKVTASSNGFLGVHANYADDLRITESSITANNTEHFNREPVSGGVKITRSRGVTVDSDNISNNVTNGLWFDESVYDIRVIDNVLLSNGHFGMEAEISAKILIAGNLIAHNVSTGIMLVDISNSSVWNNTLIDNWREFDIYQDSRIPNDPNAVGLDKRQSYPDPTMTWKDGPIDFHNNVLVGGGRDDYLFLLQDGTNQRTWAQIGVRADGNIYQRNAAKLAIIPTGPTETGYSNLSGFQEETRNDTASREANWIVLGSDLRLSSTTAAIGERIATPLPSSVAAALGRTAGSKYVGSLLRYP